MSHHHLHQQQQQKTMSNLISNRKQNCFNLLIGGATFYWRHQRRKSILSTAIVTSLFLGLLANYRLRGSSLFESGGFFSRARQNIVFLKTHKCASSTIQNILLRYGDEHNLIFALPSTANYFGHPTPFNRNFVPNVGNNSFNILTHHTRFHYQELSLLMPADTVFVSIVREPAELLESLYSYFLLHQIYEMSLETFLKNETAIIQSLAFKRYYTKMGLNQMAFDFGMEPRDFFNPEVVNRFCGVLSNQFDLVMVAEKMDESLILLMDLLRWRLEDVVVFRHNVRKSKFKTKLSSGAIQSLKRVSVADEIIYQFFLEIFEKKIRNYGTFKMAEMVRKLKEKTEQVYRNCIQSESENEEQEEEVETKNVLKSEKESVRAKTGDLSFEDRYMLQYRPKTENNILCNRLLKTELSYTDYLRKRQQKLYGGGGGPPLASSFRGQQNNNKIRKKKINKH